MIYDLWSSQIDEPHGTWFVMWDHDPLGSYARMDDFGNLFPVEESS